MGDSFHLHYQAGSSDCIGCTVYMDVCLLDSEAKCSQVLSHLVLCLWGGGGVSSEESQKGGCIRSLCKHVNSMYKSVFETELVKRFHTLAGSCEQCRRGVRFHPGPTGIVLCLPVWLWDRTGHLASWVPKARMTDTCIPLTTYPYRSLDSIYSTTLLALTHSLTQSVSLSLSLTHTHTHKACIQHIHAHTFYQLHSHTDG